MFEALIKTLISIALLVLCVFLVIWFLAEIGLALPAMVVHIFYVIAVLIAILIIYRWLVSPYWGSWWGGP